MGSRVALEALIPYIKNQGKVALRDANERFMLRSVGCASLLLKMEPNLFGMDSHSKQVGNLCFHLQTLSRKGIEGLPKNWV